ncbi:MAG: type IV pili twitching motility protein PilT, partial [Gammaproteobacteria bacterium]
APTVDRMINQFAAEKQAQIRTMLSTSLRGVVSQQLCKRADGKGRVAALELLVNTSAVANLIRHDKIDQLENAMQGGRAYGMQTMDTALKKLLDGGQITAQEAYEKAFNKSMFEARREDQAQPS